METWSFAPNGMVPETLPRENSNVISMGGWQFSARPTSTMQRKFRVRLHGMKWFLQNGSAGLYDTTTSPSINARKLEEFYSNHEMWKTFIYPHPHLGNIVVRFASPLTVPAGAPNSYGLIEPFEVELVEAGIPVP